MKSCKRVQIPIGQSLASSLSAVHSLCSVTLNASLLQCDDANAATSDVPYYEKQVDDLRGWLEAMSIAIVVYTATFALFMGYNKAQVKQQLPSYGVTQHPSTTLDQEIIAGHHQPRQVGYRDTTIGNVMFAAMITLTLAVTLEILAICLQYYVLIELSVPPEYPPLASCDGEWLGSDSKLKFHLISSISCLSLPGTSCLYGCLSSTCSIQSLGTCSGRRHPCTKPPSSVSLCRTRTPSSQMAMPLCDLVKTYGSVFIRCCRLGDKP